MPIDVSVVIPFFNPGFDIDDCLDSLLAQTLSADRFEIVLVDDGSTDGSSERVDAWVAHHRGLGSVHHIAASGGPARPRNIGVAHSRGRYVQFVDSDDALSPDALRAIVEIGDESDADIVVSKISAGGPRGVYHPLFRRTVTRRTFADYPVLIHNGTVCKAFRREFLLDHNIRLPEGKTVIEDQNLCLQAYAHAESIAVISNLVCYLHRERRSAGEHFGDVAVVPADYRRELETLVDLAEAELSPIAAQTAAIGRYYRNEVLGRLRGAAMQSFEPGYRAELVDTLAGFAAERVSSTAVESLPAMHRAQSALLLARDDAGLTAMAGQLELLRLDATATAMSWDDGVLVIDVTGRLQLDGVPLPFERAGDGWALPAVLAPGVPLADRALSASDSADLDLDLAVVSRSDSALWSTTVGLTVHIGDDGIPVFGGRVRVDPASVVGGGPLTAGIWDLRLRVIFAGINRASRLRPPDDITTSPISWVDQERSPRSITPFSDGQQRPALTLDVDEWSHSLQAMAVGSTPSLHDRRLTLPVTAVGRPSSATEAGRITLAPLDQPSLGVVEIPVAIEVSSDGASVSAVLPPLPTGSRRWALWLRLGPTGSVTPQPLSVELHSDGDQFSVQVAPQPSLA